MQRTENILEQIYVYMNIIMPISLVLLHGGLKKNKQTRAQLVLLMLDDIRPIQFTPKLALTGKTTKGLFLLAWIKFSFQHG